MLGGMIINIQASNVENLLHSQSSMGPIVSMEMHIMAWVKSLILSKIHPTELVLYGQWF